MTTTSLEPSDLAARAVTGREIRNFTVQPVEVRTNGDGVATGLVGYASVTDQPYTMYDMFGSYEEVIRSGAFTKTLAEKDDVRLLLNHEGLPLARTKSETMTLREIMDGADDPQGLNQTGLWVDADLDSRSSLAKDITFAMDRGDLDQMSFAFQVIRQVWSPDYTQRDIIEVRLFDVSVVTYPASDLTSAGLRAMNVDSLSDEEARDLLGRLQARFTTTPQNNGRSISAAKAKAASLRLPA